MANLKYLQVTIFTHFGKLANQMKGSQRTLRWLLCSEFEQSGRPLELTLNHLSFIRQSKPHKVVFL